MEPGWFGSVSSAQTGRGTELTRLAASGRLLMERYQLAKIVDWAGTLDTRKRMQKLVYLLKVAGCPLDAEYMLHRYGPYSQDVARLTDEMVQTNLLTEKTVSHIAGQQYSYRLAEAARSSLTEFEATLEGRCLSEQMEPFKPLALRLFQADLKVLEFASTIVYFHKQGHDWPTAVQKMCQFKGLTNGSQAVERADALAREVIV
jgi:uncharacterized protein